MTQDPRFYRLRQLLEEQKVSRPPEPSPAPPPVNVTTIASPPPEEHTADQEAPLRRPKSLEGMSIAELLTARADGELTEEEQDWLDSRQNMPEFYGGSGMPNLSYILKKGRRRPLKL